MELRYLLGAGLLAVVATSCSPDTPKGYLTPVAPEEKVIQDNTQVFDPKVDILFVVDNSGSMQTHQRNLSTNVTKFTSTFTKSSVLDYNIGIVTTDMTGSSWGARKPCCGQLVGNTRVVNKNTPNADSILASNFLVGTDGSAVEASFDPVVTALTPPNLTGWNNGFYRQDASLVVIFLTDAEDQSDNASPQSLYNFLLNLKQGNASKILAYGVIVPTNDTMNCDRDDMRTPLRIESFLGMVQNNKNNVMNICDPDYGTRLANMAKDIVDKVGNIIYLDRAPALDSIHVFYGNAELPENFETGWSFDPKRNAIILGSKINWSSQPSGSRVKVSYTAAKYD
ncbi:MAG: VWA domain-containing protein [Bdellovibrionales bacterium]|nr:VWA domain-containing protein [Bdellovibrionales bacterium]